MRAAEIVVSTVMTVNKAAPLLNAALSDTNQVLSKLFGRQPVPFRETTTPCLE